MRLWGEILSLIITWSNVHFVSIFWHSGVKKWVKKWPKSDQKVTKKCHFSTPKVLDIGSILGRYWVESGRYLVESGSSRPDLDEYHEIGPDFVIISLCQGGPPLRDEKMALFWSISRLFRDYSWIHVISHFWGVPPKKVITFRVQKWRNHRGFGAFLVENRVTLFVHFSRNFSRYGTFLVEKVTFLVIFCQFLGIVRN